MKIFLDNINLSSNSGPNGFARKLYRELDSKNHDLYLSLSELKSRPDVQLSFIASSAMAAPIVQRLDGIYFNSEQDFENLNAPIEATYRIADAVIFQSKFNKFLTEHYFGKRDNAHVISNGTCLDVIEKIEPLEHELLDKFSNVWCCASSWRPHKRLSENIRYFLENAPEDDCLVVAGENPDFAVGNERIIYCGNLSWPDLISLFKRASHFIHLAWLDHCPNVVIDARAAGCHIICSSSGGTPEICGKNSTVILEEVWDFKPTKLYSPPKMDFSKEVKVTFDSDIDIVNTAEEYMKVLREVTK